MPITTATAQGERPYQEDRYIVLPNGYGVLLGVFDGHGGDKASAACAERLIPSVFDLFNPHLGLTTIFNQLQALTNDMDEGTTASLVFIPAENNRAYVAVLGDSPVVIRDDAEQVVLSPEHNARTNMAERAAAQKRGAHYSGGYLCNRNGDGLQMSRALGDRHLPFVSHEPELYSVALGPQSFVLLATDGLFDPSHQDGLKQELAVGEVIDGGADAGVLVKRALQAKTGDNATAVLWLPNV